MNSRNMRNIRTRFRERAGVHLKTEPAPRILQTVTAVLAVALLHSVVVGPERLAVQAQELKRAFYPEPGTPFSVEARYEGDGVVNLCVENYTDEDMVFETPRF